MKSTALHAWFLMLALAFVSSCGLMDSGPASTVKAFYKETETGKLTEAVERVTGPAVQMMGKEKLKAGLALQTEKIKQKGGIKSIEIKSEEINGEMATVEALLTYGDGSTETDKEKLVKGEKGWLIVVEL